MNSNEILWAYQGGRSGGVSDGDGQWKWQWKIVAQPVRETSGYGTKSKTEENDQLC